MSKVRVYEIAKELDVSNAEIIDRARDLGIEVENHLSQIGEDDAKRVKAALSRQSEGPVTEKRVARTVIRRRPKKRSVADDLDSDFIADAQDGDDVLPGRDDEPVEAERPERVEKQDLVGEQSEEPAAPELEEPEQADEPEVVAEPEPLPESEPEVEPAELSHGAVEPQVQAEEPVAAVEPSAEPEVGSEPVTVEPEVEVAATSEQPEVQPAVEEPKAGVEPEAGDESKAEGEAGEPESQVPETPEEARVRQAIADELKAELAKIVSQQAFDEREEEPKVKKKKPREGFRAVVVSLPDPVEIAAQERESERFRRAASAPAAPAFQEPGDAAAAAASARAKGRKGGPGGDDDSGPKKGRRVIYDRRQPSGGYSNAGANGARPTTGKKKGKKKDRMREADFLTQQPQKHIKRTVKVDSTISVGELANGLAIKASELIRTLVNMGMMATVNQILDFETASLVAEELGHEIQNVAFDMDEHLAITEDTGEDMVSRNPVVTIMGHVDHGKTSLLDQIQKSNIAAGEAGGITQSIGAYVVSTSKGDVTFIDTPGHEAFSAMRARGAKVTDLVVLVVAADDGVMPQTVEAIKHAQSAKVPIIVAINKIDKPGHDTLRIKQQLMEYELLAEEWGGSTIFMEVSAKTRQGIPELLEMIAIQSEMLELAANPDKRASGIVLESKLEKGRGPVATVLVQEGTLNVGDMMVSGIFYGKVRAMISHSGEMVKSAGPSMPVEVLGLNGVPNASDPFNIVVDERTAKAVTDHRYEKERDERMAKNTRLSLEELFAKTSDEERKEIAVVLKADSQGAVEAVGQALRKLDNRQVAIRVIHEAVGGITESDVNLAMTSEGFIVGFNVRPSTKAKALADQFGIEVQLFSLIHDLIDRVKAAMEGALDAEAKEVILGQAEVRQVFSVPKFGKIAGCYVIDGKVVRSAQVRLIRNSIVVWQGRLGSLKRFKDDAKEVVQGYECGIGLDGYNDLKNGDIIESFMIEMVAAKLDPEP